MRGRGVAELVVDDEVNRAADLVAVDLGHVERLAHHTLTGEGGVTVEQQRQYGVVAAAALVHVGPGHADHDRIDRFQVRRVGSQLDVDNVASGAGVLAFKAQVVLHIARALDGVFVDRPFKFAEQVLVVLAQDVDQHIESSPVSHADDGSLHVGIGCGREDRIDGGNGALIALDPESLLTHVAGGQELLDRF